MDGNSFKRVEISFGYADVAKGAGAFFL